MVKSASAAGLKNREPPKRDADKTFVLLLETVSSCIIKYLDVRDIARWAICAKSFKIKLPNLFLYTKRMELDDKINNLFLDSTTPYGFIVSELEGPHPF